MKEITISEYTHPIYTHRVSYPVIVDGKLKRKYKGFKSEAEAKRFKKEQKPLTQSAGLELGGMYAEEKRAMSQWRQFKKSLPEGVKIPSLDSLIAEQIKQLKTSMDSSTIKSAITILIRQKEINEKKGTRYVDDIISKLKPFETHFGSDTLLSTITVQDLEAWFFTMEKAPRTVNHHRRMVGTLYNFAVKKGWVTSNPIPLTIKMTVEDTEVHTLTPAQMKKALKAATDSDVMAGIILQGFCGLRSSEFLRVTWEMINGTHIHLKKGKIGKRTIELTKNAIKHLKPLKRKTGKVWNRGERQYYNAIKNILDVFELESQQNILRHSYCTYHVAAFRSLGDTALNAGNSETVIRKHYLNLATQKQGLAYFAI